MSTFLLLIFLAILVAILKEAIKSFIKERVAASFPLVLHNSIYHRNQVEFVRECQQKDTTILHANIQENSP
jgi:hypothetical protein